MSNVFRVVLVIAALAGGTCMVWGGVTGARAVFDAAHQGMWALVVIAFIAQRMDA